MKGEEEQESDKLSESLKMKKQMFQQPSRSELLKDKQKEKSLESDISKGIHRRTSLKFERKTDQSLQIFNKQIGQNKKKQVIPYEYNTQPESSDYQLLSFNYKQKNEDDIPFPGISSIAKNKQTLSNVVKRTSFLESNEQESSILKQSQSHYIQISEKLKLNQSNSLIQIKSIEAKKNSKIQNIISREQKMKTKYSASPN